MFAACAVSLSCSHSKGSGQDSAAVSSSTGPVHAIILPHYQPNLPDAPGRDAFASNCLACHSTRYITMQPASFDQAKWEAEAKKMVKPYGAPIADDQIPIIAQYIVAARKADPGAWESMAVQNQVKVPPKAAAASPGEVNHGRALYTQHCASCHGTDGKSQTVAAKPMLPRPTDLTSGRFAPQAIAAAIVSGVRGTAMPAFPTLSQSDVGNVVAFTTSLFPEASASPSGNAPSESQIAQGKTLFQQECVSCHGPEGTGNGYAAPPLARVPANFHLRQPGLQVAIDAITSGVPGTAMPAWKEKFTQPQREALASYVRTLFNAAD
jgi:sulfite dehydrogenase